jgi:hypothetical protein
MLQLLHLGLRKGLLQDFVEQVLHVKIMQVNLIFKKEGKTNSFYTISAIYKMYRPSKSLFVRETIE